MGPPPQASRVARPRTRLCEVKGSERGRVGVGESDSAPMWEKGVGRGRAQRRLRRRGGEVGFQAHLSLYVTVSADPTVLVSPMAIQWRKIIGSLSCRPINHVMPHVGIAGRTNGLGTALHHACAFFLCQAHADRVRPIWPYIGGNRRD